MAKKPTTLPQIGDGFDDVLSTLAKNQSNSFMTEIQSFKYESYNIRTVYINDEVWFVAKDVGICLDLADFRTSVKLLDVDDRHSMPVIDSIGREQETIIINESGLYNLIFQSRKPEAKKFKKWVTSDVLPSIRKTSKYQLP